MTNEKIPSPKEILKSLSPQDFQSLGLEQIAYIRPTTLNDRAVWSVCAADGHKISTHLTPKAAAAAARQGDLKPQSIQ